MSLTPNLHLKKNGDLFAREGGTHTYIYILVMDGVSNNWERSHTLIHNIVVDTKMHVKCIYNGEKENYNKFLFKFSSC